MKYYYKNTLAQAIRESVPDKKYKLSEKQIKMLKTSAHVILAIAAIAGVVAVAAIAPNIFQILGKKGKFRSADPEKRYRQVAKSFYYLKREGYIEWHKAGRELVLKLTGKGKNKLSALDFETMMVSHPKRWDGNWWLVLADVPQAYRYQEDLLRAKLKLMNFYPFQRSVWIYPYNPRTEIDTVARFYEIERFVTTMQVSKVEKPDEAALLEFFKKKAIL